MLRSGVDVNRRKKRIIEMAQEWSLYFYQYWQTRYSYLTKLYRKNPLKGSHSTSDIFLVQVKKISIYVYLLIRVKFNNNMISEQIKR